MTALQPGDHAFVTALERALPAVPVLVSQLHLAAAGPEEKYLSILRSQLLPRCRDVEPERVGHRFEQPVEVHAPRT